MNKVRLYSEETVNVNQGQVQGDGNEKGMEKMRMVEQHALKRMWYEVSLFHLGTTLAAALLLAFLCLRRQP